MTDATKRRIGFVTCAEKPELTPDDALVADQLQSASIESAVWDRTTGDDLDLLVLRSCWDYHLRLEEFRSWIEDVAASGPPLLNHPDLVLWNCDKRYLQDLAEMGCAVVDTRFLEGEELSSERDAGVTRIRDLLLAEGWTRIVVKPAVSASSLHTWTTTIGDLASHEDQLRATAGQGVVMVQPFVDEIVEQGEWSIVFFGGEFSHAVLKQAKKGEFRVQSEFGGSATSLSPPSSLLEDAAAIVASLSTVPAYARIDGIDRQGRFHLAEAELIEPDLFLRTSPEAPQRFAREIEATLFSS